jgi:DNA-binding NarL/FixJ family response regulator
LQRNLLYNPSPKRVKAVRRRVRGSSEGRAMGLRGNGKDGTRIDVLVVRNDTTLFTDVLAKALASEPSVHLLSPPLTVDEALEFCIRHHPDVVLVEATETSGGSLRRLVSSVTGACDGSPVVLLADELIDDAFLVAGVEGGAFGIVDGAAGIGEVFRALRAAAAGRRLVDPDRFMSAVETTARARENGSDLAARVRQLTDREQEVLACLSEGLRNVEIAERLAISPRTVDKHVEHILRKLDARSRLHAVALAARMEDATYGSMRGTA